MRVASVNSLGVASIGGVWRREARRFQNSISQKVHHRSWSNFAKSCTKPSSSPCQRFTEVFFRRGEKRSLHGTPASISGILPVFENQFLKKYITDLDEICCAIARYPHQRPVKFSRKYFSLKSSKNVKCDPTFGRYLEMLTSKINFSENTQLNCPKFSPKFHQNIAHPAQSGLRT